VKRWLARLLERRATSLLPQSLRVRLAAIGDVDDCYECDRLTVWDGEVCTGCGRTWGYDADWPYEVKP
jgi:hypothetical protein